MNRRASLILMELLVMVLIFSLAAAACLGVFAGARRMTEETARLDRAVLLAQNTAQLLKAGRDPGGLDSGELTVRIEALPPEIPGLKQVRIGIFFGEEPVFSLDTGWQEVLP